MSILFSVSSFHTLVANTNSVIIRVGSSDYFSRDLLDLEREVERIKNRNPCPKKYKATYELSSKLLTLFPYAFVTIYVSHTISCSLFLTPMFAMSRSAEYLFRRKNFLNDWCSFHLIRVSFTFLPFFPAFYRNFPPMTVPPSFPRHVSLDGLTDISACHVSIPFRNF